MYANKNKSKTRTRSVARGADSTKLSSTDSRYDAGDYEAVPASIRKIRDERNRELEEANALPAEEIIARQEAEIAELKRQAEAANMTNKYKAVLDDEEEHPTFTNPESMADFGDYEAVAASARLDAANHDPGQKVFRAKPSGGRSRKVADVSQMDPDQYEAVAASARKAVPPDEYLAAKDQENEPAPETPAEAPAPDSPVEAPAPAAESKPKDIHIPSGGYKVDVEPDENYKTDAEIIRSSEENQAANIDIPSGGYKVQVEPDENYMTDAEAIRYDKNTPSREVPEYTYVEYPEDKAPAEETPAPAPAPAPVSAADYQTAPEPVEAPKPAPAPVSAADYMVQTPTYTAPEPAYTAPQQTYTAPEPAYTAPQQTYTAPEPTYTAPTPSYNAPKPSYQEAEPSYDDTYNDLNRAPGPITPKSTGSRKIASVVDIAPGDYEAVASSSLDDSDFDFADGSYDFDKFLANAPTLHMQPAPAPAPAENDWADLANENEEPEPDITEEQTRELAAAIAEETMTNQPGTKFEDLIDNVIAKVMERKKQEEAKENNPQPAQPEQPAQPQPQQPAQQPQPQQPAQLQQPAQPQQPEQPAQPQPQQPAQPEQQPEPKHEFEPGFIPSNTPIEDIPAVIVAELDSVEGDVSDDDIKLAIDSVLITKLTSGELTLDSVQPARDSILSEIKEMQDEEARIIAELEGKPVEEPKEPEPVEEPAPVEEPKEPEPVEEQAPVEQPKEPEPVEEQAPVEQPKEPEPVEEQAPVEQPKEPEPIDTTNIHYVIEKPEFNAVNAKAAEPQEEPVKETVKEPVEDTEEEPLAETEEETAEETVEEPEEKLEEKSEDDTFEGVPLSAAAVIANQNAESNEAPEEIPAVEEVTEEISEPEETSQVEEAPEVISEPEEIPEIETEPEEVPAVKSEPEEAEEVPPAESELEAPEEVPAVKSEPEVAEEVYEPEEIIEADTLPEDTDESDVGMQMTFDDIFRNPFINDFTPQEAVISPESEETAAAETVAEDKETPSEPQSEPETEAEVELVAEEPTEETEAEVEPVAEEPVDVKKEPADDFPDFDADEIEATVESVFTDVKEENKPEESPASEEPDTELAAEPEDAPNIGVDFVSDEAEAALDEEEEPDEYAAAKEKRHEDMQNALLLAMVDDKDETFSDAVRHLIEKMELSAKTLRARMPIDRDQLDKILIDPEYIPDKKTAIAICFALRLTWEDSVRLLYKAGYTLKDSDRYDLTIEYLMRRGVYDQNMINSVLRGSGLDGFGIPQSEL